MRSNRMRARSALAALAVVSALLRPVRAEDAAPDWAYPVAPHDYVPPKDDGTIRHVPGATLGSP